MHQELSSFSGEIVATDHVEEVSGITANGSGSTWTDIHREIWIRPARGTERKFTFSNVDIPARDGHRVTLLLRAGRPVGLVNFSTKQYVNLVSPCQFELFDATEAFAFAALLVAAGLTGLVALAVLFIGAVAYGLAKGLMRQERYREASASTEAQIHATIAHAPKTLAYDHSQPTTPRYPRQATK